MYQNGSLTNLTKEILFVDNICDNKPAWESQCKPLKREWWCVIRNWFSGWWGWCSYTPGFREFVVVSGVSVVEETGAAEDECSHTSPVGH